MFKLCFLFAVAYTTDISLRSRFNAGSAQLLASQTHYTHVHSVTAQMPRCRNPSVNQRNRPDRHEVITDANTWPYDAATASYEQQGISRGPWMDPPCPASHINTRTQRPSAQQRSGECSLVAFISFVN